MMFLGVVRVTVEHNVKKLHVQVEPTLLRQLARNASKMPSRAHSKATDALWRVGHIWYMTTQRIQ